MDLMALWSTHDFMCGPSSPTLFLFNDPATTEIYALSLHDALPIFPQSAARTCARREQRGGLREPRRGSRRAGILAGARSEEHTSELQSHLNIVCRLLLEKKKNHESLRRWQTTQIAQNTMTRILSSA